MARIEQRLIAIAGSGPHELEDRTLALGPAQRGRPKQITVGIGDQVVFAGATVVVDSAFLQTSVWITLRRNLDGEIIRTFVARIADIIRPLDPALVYFHEPDAATAFRAICDKRGMAWTVQHIVGFDGSPWARTRGASGSTSCTRRS